MATLLYAVGLLAVAAFLATVVGDVGWMTRQDFHQEITKVAIQVLVFGLVGGSVKLLLDARKERRKFRSTMLERLGAAHREVYLVRRLVGKAQGEERSRLLGQLMNARQGLGDVFHEIRAWGLGRTIGLVQTETEAMRSYLERVIEGALGSDKPHVKAAYADFLAWDSGGRLYDIDFKRHYLSAKNLIDPSYVPPTPLAAPTPPTT